LLTHSLIHRPIHSLLHATVYLSVTTFLLRIPSDMTSGVAAAVASNHNVVPNSNKELSNKPQLFIEFTFTWLIVLTFTERGKSNFLIKINILPSQGLCRPERPNHSPSPPHLSPHNITLRGGFTVKLMELNFKASYLHGLLPRSWERL
jgi:hypothetical protein